MRREQVKIGGLYLAKVSNKLAVVRILNARLIGKGWTAKNQCTGRNVFILSARRLRREIDESNLGKFIELLARLGK